ncbi:response regulator transcription factor [Streptomyces sp. NPDC004610]|uniref:response regulator transcription factor n=1 Tax=unclassified Streptomyces TaxID=2593676 RepID=UPI0033B8B1FD
MNESRIRVLVADDEALMRAGIRLILENADDIEVTAEAADGAEAAAACRAGGIDVALLDLQMPGRDGIAAAEDITRLSPRTAVVMLTAFGEEASVTRALRAGASGYLLKDTGPTDLIDAVRRAARGEPVLAPRVTRQLLDRHLRSGRDTGTALTRIADLTPAEREVLRLLGTGLSNAEIAGQLYLSAGTVKAHISRILTRTGCANRVQAAVLAHDAGLLDGS